MTPPSGDNLGVLDYHLKAAGGVENDSVIWIRGWRAHVSKPIVQVEGT